MSRTLPELTNLCRSAVRCRKCFEAGVCTPAYVDLAQPRWVGPRYWDATPRVLVVMLNPGSGAARADSADERLRQLLHGFRAGTVDSQDIFDHQAQDMPNWGNGRFKRFYLDGLGLPWDETAFANVAWCATSGNEYPRPMLQACFSQHTKPLIKLLAPGVVILSGSGTANFAGEIRSALPKTRVVETLHYAHRKGGAAEQAELAKVRRLLS